MPRKRAQSPSIAEDVAALRREVRRLTELVRTLQTAALNAAGAAARAEETVRNATARWTARPPKP